MKKFFIFSLSLLFFLDCSNSKSSDKEKEIFILGFIVANASKNISTNSTNQTSSFNCSNPTPSFSTLAQAGTTSNCASCHS
ncbi:MAG: hypothetical protein N3A69_15815, partial [Leptospiraceae bacterium]|nr:hypothetical protein [Leptospiraceae bacterium]